MPALAPASTTAAAALREAAALLDRQSERRVRAASVATGDWAGPARAAFDVELLRITRRSVDLAHAMRSAARAVDAAAAEAAAASAAALRRAEAGIPA